MRRNKKGSLLLEALLATVILSVSISMIVQSMMTSLRAMTISTQYTIALNLLENKMSELMRDGFVAKDLSEEGDFSGLYDRYQYSLTTDLLQEEGGEKISEVDLKVFWNSGKRENNIALKTYFLDGSQ